MINAAGLRILTGFFKKDEKIMSPSHGCSECTVNDKEKPPLAMPNTAKKRFSQKTQPI